MRVFCKTMALLAVLTGSELIAQNTLANVQQSVVFAGLRTGAGAGGFHSVAVDPAGNIYLLEDRQDGVRILKVASDGGAILASALLGAKGDDGVALALDPTGSVYVAGTTSSGALNATSGAAISTATPATTNSFIAKLDPNLNLLFLSFLGGSRIAASAVAASADAVFVTGITYADDLPVTPSAIQQQPAYASVQNGFVECFSTDGSTLQYATYLTGALGDTTPTSLAVDAADDAWIVGQTSASGFPTIAALVPDILGPTSGFLLRLTPAGDAIVFSTFIPGEGMSAIALDSTASVLLVSGNVSLGQFAVDTIAAPIVPAAYQVLLRLPIDGSSVVSGTLLSPGAQSVVAPAANGSAWVAGEFDTTALPLLPQPAIAAFGDAYAVRINASGAVDETLRFGGVPDQNLTYASLPLAASGVTSDSAGNVIFAGQITPTVSASLLAAETFDLPLEGGLTAALPSSLRDTLANTGGCQGSLCTGSAGYLSKISFANATPSLLVSLDDLPFVTIRNGSSTSANGLSVSVSSGTISSTCGTSLSSGAECNAALSRGTSGSLTVAAAGAVSQILSYGGYIDAPTPKSVVVSPPELDFGISSSVSAQALATLTLANLGPQVETFESKPVGAPTIQSPFSELSSDCPAGNSVTTKTLQPGTSCHVTIALTVSSDASRDGFLRSAWTIGTRQVLLTAYGRAAAISLSANEIDFGTEIQGGLLSPRYLYLSNLSDKPQSHTEISLPSTSPFVLSDGCAAVMSPQSICQIRIDYVSTVAPSNDSVTLSLDGGLSVLITGVTRPAPTGTGSTGAADLTVSQTSVTFVDAVVVTGVSSEAQTVAITNSGGTATALSLALQGDFTQVTSCGNSLDPGATCAVTLFFAPSQPGIRQGLLTVSGTSGTIGVSLSGSGQALLASNNGTLLFGEVPIGQPLVQFYKIIPPFTDLKVAATAPFLVTLIEDTGAGHGTPPSSAFVMSGEGTCHNCWLAVRFQPTIVGAQTGTLSFSSAPLGNPYLLTLSGAGIADTGLVITPSAADFGAIPVGSGSASKPFLLTNLSSLAESITLATPQTSGDFAIEITVANGSPCIGQLAFGASCTILMQFDPSALGPRNGSLNVTSSAGPVSVALTGTGTPASALAISPLALQFNSGNTASDTQTLTLTNQSQQTLAIGTPTNATSNFSANSGCTSLLPAANCTISILYQPALQPVTDQLAIPVQSPASNGQPQTQVYSVPLTGAVTSVSTGITLSPITSNFGPTATGVEGSSRLLALTNNSAQSQNVSFSLPRDFGLLDTSCPLTLAPGLSCNLDIAFLPLTNGDLPGTLTVTAIPADGSPPLQAIAYTEGFGIGSGALTIMGGLIVNSVFNFGQVAPGQSSSQIFTISNHGASGSPSIHIRRITSNAPFPSATDCKLPLALAASCSITVTYTPVSSSTGGTVQSDSGSLIIESDAQSGPDIVHLTGQTVGTGASGSTSPLNTFSLSTQSLTFPSTSVGDSSPAQTLVLSNTGNVSLQILDVVTSVDFTVLNGCSFVLVGANCSISIVSTPQSAGTHLDALEIFSSGTSALEFASLLSTAVASPLSLSPSSLNFGSVQVGSSATLSVQLSNTGQSAIEIAGLSATSNYAASGTCGANSSLPPGATCVATITFSPNTAGPDAGVLSITSSASTKPLTLSLSGTAIASQLVIAPSTLNFGSIVLGGAAVLDITLNNSGTASLIGLTLTVTGDYAVTKPCPTTLAPAVSCDAQITFTPTLLGSRQAALAVSSSDPSSPENIPLLGNGLVDASFNLLVNGSTNATLTLQSGATAAFPLMLTPIGGFAGEVALTCAPNQSTLYAACSLLPSTLTLGASPLASSASISTLASASTAGPLTQHRLAPTYGALAWASIFPCILFAVRSRRHRRSALFCLLLALTAWFSVSAVGCGKGGTSTGTPIQYTPPGTYQFTVRASSVSGLQLVQTVNLTLIVTAH